MNATVIPALFARAEKNEKYANDGSYESVRAQAVRLAGKCYARVQAMGLPMEFDDVLQELNVSYVQARAAWKPDGSSRFSTYFQTAAINNFNRSIAKMERDRKEIGLVSVHDLVGQTEDGEGTDPMELLHSAAAPEVDSPDYRMNRESELRATIAALSPAARSLVATLLMNERRSANSLQKPPRLREMAAQCGLQGDELRRVKVELLGKFGVTWH